MLFFFAPRLAAIYRRLLWNSRCSTWLVSYAEGWRERATSVRRRTGKYWVPTWNWTFRRPKQGHGNLVIPLNHWMWTFLWQRGYGSWLAWPDFILFSVLFVTSCSLMSNVNIMLMMSTQAAKHHSRLASAYSKMDGDEEEDLAVLIYKSSKTTKARAAAAAAAAAAEEKGRWKLPAGLRTARTSTRKRSFATQDNEASIDRPGKRSAAIKNKRNFTEDNQQVGGNADWRKYAKICSANGCTTLARKGQVCIRHGATWTNKKYSSEGCTNQAHKGGVCKRSFATQDNEASIDRPGKRSAAIKNKRNFTEDNQQVGGNADWRKYAKICSANGCTTLARKGQVCIRHGATWTNKKYSSEGCTNQAHKGGVCKRHGAKSKLCSKEGCTNVVIKGGVCVKHGAKVKIYLCNSEGCTNKAHCGHGAKRKRCSNDGCTNQAQRGGVCKKHGANCTPYDASTAFGSEYEKTTAIWLYAISALLEIHTKEVVMMFLGRLSSVKKS